MYTLKKKPNTNMFAVFTPDNRLVFSYPNKWLCIKIRNALNVIADHERKLSRMLEISKENQE